MISAYLGHSHPVKVVLVDIDGCILSHSNQQSVDLSALARLSEFNQLSRKKSEIPPVTICSGRPQPFVELLLKIICGYVPALFEWGGGMFDPLNNEVFYHKLFTKEIRQSRQVIEQIIWEELVEKQGARIQPGKEVALTIYPDPSMSVNYLCQALKELLHSNQADKNHDIHCARTHVDLLPAGLEKGIGAQWLADFLQFRVEEIAAIGDDESDLGLLQLVGISACPSNATSAVKESVQYVSPYKEGRAVVDILEKIIGEKI